MPVVIKDFEVVAPSSGGQSEGQGQGGGGASAGGAAPDRAAMADEIATLLRARRERKERLHVC